MLEPSLIISLLALTISAANFFIAWAAFRRTHLGQVAVECHHSASSGKVLVRVINTGARPITITELVLGYGTAPVDMAPIADLTSRLDSALLPIGDARVIAFSTAELHQMVRTSRLEQGRYRRVWIRARVAGGGTIEQVVRADESCIPADTLVAASHFVAADMMLGFEPMQPQIFPAGLLTK